MRVADDLKQFGAACTLIITTPPVRAAAERIADAIRAQGIRVPVWGDCVHEPSIADFSRARDAAF